MGTAGRRAPRVSALLLADTFCQAEHVLAMMLRTSPQGAAAALRARAERPGYTDLLARTSVPALIMVGRDDEFTHRC